MKFIQPELETKGTTFETSFLYTECKCGKVVTQKRYKEFGMSDDEETGWEIMIGFCPCGNTFVSQYPLKRN